MRQILLEIRQCPVEHDKSSFAGSAALNARHSVSDGFKEFVWMSDSGSPGPPISAELLQAYRSTRFRVLAPDGDFVMSIDAECPELSLCHSRHGVTSSLFITAWNPASVVLPDFQNAAAQQRLRKAIARRGFATIDGRGEDPRGQWEPEASLLVLGIQEAEALLLGRQFRQNTIVFAGPDAIPRLLLTSRGSA